MSTTLNDKMTDICYPLMENKKKMCNSRNVCYYGNKPSHCLEFSLTIIFKANFLLTEKKMCILKMFTNRRSLSKKKLNDVRNLRYHGKNFIKLF